MNATQESISASDLLDSVVRFSGGDVRGGQVEMVEHVAEAIAQHEHRIIQAGTGTGKSLGYLVPAAAHSLNSKKSTVVVSTATLALQRQLVEKDLPLLAQCVSEEFGKELTYAVLKGRNNYVCLQKLHSAIPDPDQDALFEESPTSLGVQARLVREWAESTPSGDRDEYREDIDARVWRGFSVSRRECVGESKCAFGQECFTAQRRAQAAQANIVVTNHALLAIDVIEGIPVLPEHDVVIIDEGHEIVDRATAAITSELTVAMVERAAQAARNLIEDRTSDLLADAIDSLESELALSAPGNVSPRVIEQVPPGLLLALTMVRDALAAGITEIGGLKVDDPDVMARNHRARGGLEELHDVAGAFISQSASLAQDYVIWLSTNGRSVSLHSAPLSVARLLESRLFEEKAVVITSATLAVGGSFDAVSRSLGIDGDPRVTSVDVGSPFNYSTQGILYVASHLDAPSREGLTMEALDELGELVEAAGGRTLILCSSWNAVDKAADYLRVRIDTPLYVQRKGESAGLLVQKFAEDESSSLIGTLSLWQGVDIPGASCSQVIIDRIPFPRPDDPVMSARARAVDNAGGSGFTTVMVARAGLLMAQAAGRLIRHHSDRGVVSVLDSRLANARYGRIIRNSMPPLWYTTDKSVTVAALQRLNP